MPIIIAHRGLLNGPNKELENKTETILNAIKQGFYAEVDVWRNEKGFEKDQLYLGHDFPQYKIDSDFLFSNKQFLYCHAKNSGALFWLISNKFRCFSHDQDPYSLVSDGIIWAFPSQPIDENTICVMPERVKEKQNWKQCYGVCTDFAVKYRDEYLFK